MFFSLYCVHIHLNCFMKIRAAKTYNFYVVIDTNVKLYNAIYIHVISHLTSFVDMQIHKTSLGDILNCMTSLVNK